MRYRIAFMLGSLAMAFTLSAAVAAEGSPAKGGAKHTISSNPSMAEKGAFHRVHAKNVKTNCDDCHTKGQLPDNTLRLRLNDRLAKGDPGPVDTETCFDCHRRANKPLPYYAKKNGD